MPESRTAVSRQITLLVLLVVWNVGFFPRAAWNGNMCFPAMQWKASRGQDVSNGVRE